MAATGAVKGRMTGVLTVVKRHHCLVIIHGALSIDGRIWVYSQTTDLSLRFTKLILFSLILLSLSRSFFLCVLICNQPRTYISFLDGIVPENKDAIQQHHHARNELISCATHA